MLIFLSSLTRISSIEVETSIEEIRNNDERKINLRPVSSMMTFPLRHNFPPLSMRITSWIVKKKSAYAEKVVRKKVELQATFFVRFVRSLINL